MLVNYYGSYTITIMNPFRNLIAHVKVLQSVKVKSNYILNLLTII